MQELRTLPRVGLALGGGGARGIAHVAVIEALDEMGIVPTALAGTSIGAIYAAARASGLDGASLRARTLESFGDRSAAFAKLWNRRPKKFGDLFSGSWSLGQLSPETVLDIFVPEAFAATFADCSIPLAVVATDFWGGREAVLSSGDLRRAVAASIALPSIFKSVVIDGRVLMDGGVMNPVPVDALPVDVDLVVAVDVVSYPEPDEGKALPGALQAVIGATQLMQQQIAAYKFETRRPDVLIRPPVNDVHVLDFLGAEKILAAAEPVKDEVKRKLGRLIEAW